MAHNEVALSADSVSVKYGTITALSDLSFKAREGEVLGIIGPNGAGKSSSFAALTNSVTRSGQVWLYGDEISPTPTRTLSRKGLRRTFQQNSFFGDLTVLENTMAAFQLRNGSPLLESVFTPWKEMRRRDTRRDAAQELLKRFGIAERYHDLLPDDLPLGLQRLLSIVVAYGDGIRVLLIDEPGAGVGGHDMRDLAQLLHRLRDEGLAIVLIEHHMDLVMEICDRIIVIDRGETIAHGSPSEIQRDPRVLEAYLGKST